MGACYSTKKSVARPHTFDIPLKAPPSPIKKKPYLFGKVDPIPVPLPLPPPLFESEPHPSIETRATAPPKSSSRVADDSLLVSGLRSYSYQELAAATNFFRAENELGAGGFGRVYKGFLTANGMATGGTIPVAIKKLDEVSYQGHKEWVQEVSVLGKLAHPNLVLLLGFCDQHGERLLVYEFLPQGSLDYHLFTAVSIAPPVSWQLRLKIALHAAQGLRHLHKRNIIHRDFKASNILLDKSFSAKLTDFGMAKDGPEPGMSHVSTTVMGTMGYLDPRYAETGKLTRKSDVYAFGVVLLELLSGRKAMDETPGGQPLPITIWASPYLNEKKLNFEALVDPRLEDPFPPLVAKSFASVAKQCIQTNPDVRPDMELVIIVLSSMQALITA